MLHFHVGPPGLYFSIEFTTITIGQVSHVFRGYGHGFVRLMFFVCLCVCYLWQGCLLLQDNVKCVCIRCGTFATLTVVIFKFLCENAIILLTEFGQPSAVVLTVRLSHCISRVGNSLRMCGLPHIIAHDTAVVFVCVCARKTTHCTSSCAHATQPTLAFTSTQHTRTRRTQTPPRESPSVGISCGESPTYNFSNIRNAYAGQHTHEI